MINSVKMGQLKTLISIYETLNDKKRHTINKLIKVFKTMRGRGLVLFPRMDGLENQKLSRRDRCEDHLNRQ